MSSIIRLTESCNTIPVKAAVLSWTGTAVLIKMCQIYPNNHYHRCSRWKEKLKNYSISTFPGTSGLEKKNMVCSCDLPVSTFHPEVIATISVPISDSWDLNYEYEFFWWLSMNDVGGWRVFVPKRGCTETHPRVLVHFVSTMKILNLQPILIPAWLCK